MTYEPNTGIEMEILMLLKRLNDVKTSCRTPEQCETARSFERLVERRVAEILKIDDEVIYECCD